MAERDPLAEILERLEQPTSPRPEFADVLLERLLRELEGEPARLRRLRPRGPGRERFRRLAVIAAALALGVVAVAVAVLPFRGAREAAPGQFGPFGEMPPFRATLERRIPAETVNELIEGIREEQAGPSPEPVPESPPEPAPDRLVRLRLSYDGAGAWRIDFLADSFPIPGRAEPTPGSFLVYNGTVLTEYRAETNTYAQREGPVGSLLDLWSWDATQEARSRWGDACAVRETLPDQAVVDRPARHLRCDPWELWVDAETGLILRLRLEAGVSIPVPAPLGFLGGETQEFTDVEYDPSFAPDTFRFTPPPGATSETEAAEKEPLTGLTIGKPAPPLRGELLEGGAFDLASLRGKPTAVYFWATWCPPCLGDALDAFDAAYRDRRSEIEFVSVAYVDETSAVAEFVSETGIEVPVVLGDERVSEDWRVLGIPTLILLDAEGRFVGAYGAPVRGPDLRDILEALVAGEPPPEVGGNVQEQLT